MRRIAVVVAMGVLSACSFGLQGVPKTREIESTFPNKPLMTELPKQLEVVSFNVHKEPAKKFVDGIKADRVVRDADLIVLQEVPRWDDKCSAACGAGTLFGYYAVYAPTHHHEDMDIGTAVLSKSPITSARIIELPWNDVHFNAGRRASLVVTVQQGGRPITVYAVHLENRLSTKDRRRQMTPILEDAKRQQTPVIIAGDVNTNPFHWVSHWLPLPTGSNQANKLEALVRSYGFDTPVRESGATHRYIGMRLDAIYTRGFETKRFGVARANDVSDHLPLWAMMAQRPDALPASPARMAPKPSIAASK